MKNIQLTPRQWISFILVLFLYLLFLLWVESWWGLLVVPFIVDAYVTHFIPWSWWRKSDNPLVHVVMSWVDAIIFAAVAIYFINLYFFQNFVIPSSSLEKSLLTGDYLLVSKLSYGPRIPQTPLTMPLTQHNLPAWLGGGKSYFEKPHWDYRRIKGFGQVKEGDIVVFNYPSGDTLASKLPAQDYYQLVYLEGARNLGIDQPAPGLSPLQQRALFAKIYATGRNEVRSRSEFGEILSRPTDRRENYVKRCVGLPGQTLQIKNNVIYLDGKPRPQPHDVQFNYIVHFNSQPSIDFCKENGVTIEDLSQTDGNSVAMPLTMELLAKLKAHPELATVEGKAPSYNLWLFPLNLAKDWTTSDYGPVWIPKKGSTVSLSLENLPIYERCIAVYENNRLEVHGDRIYINCKRTDHYTFKMEYYWMMGDNRDNSADSRFWGFVPEDHIVGKPLMIWISLDKDYGLFDGKIRWNRFFKWVADLR